MTDQGAAGERERSLEAPERTQPGLSRRPDGAAPDYLGAATSPRMLVLLLVLLALALGCARLGMWQLERAVERSAQNEAVRAAELAEAPPQPLPEVLRPQQSFPGDLVGRRVVVSGEFEGQALLVPGRAFEGDVGYLVLDAFRVGGAVGADDAVGADSASEPPGMPPALPVVRGWVPDAQDPPPPPSGPLELTGYLQAGEAAATGEVPAGQIGAVSPAQLVNLWQGPTYTGYLVLSAPAQDGVAPLPPPTVPGGGLDLQNLAYALQWWIFGAFAVLLWVRLVRDDARERVDPVPRSRNPDGPPGGPDPERAEGAGPVVAARHVAAAEGAASDGAVAPTYPATGAGAGADAPTPHATGAGDRVRATG